MKLLSVEDLHTHFVSRSLDNEVRVARALNGVGFSLERGRILGLVGETGAGKSLTALSIMGLLRPPARIVAGRIDFEGQDLVSLPPERLNALRGDRLALIVQNPRASLDPLARIGDQLARAHRAHRKVDAAAAQRRAVGCNERVADIVWKNCDSTLLHHLKGAVGIGARVDYGHCCHLDLGLGNWRL